MGIMKFLGNWTLQEFQLIESFDDLIFWHNDTIKHYNDRKNNQ